MLKASDFRKKEVINLNSNEKMGYVCDFEICTTSGEISAIIVPKKTHGLHVGKDKTIRIAWENITGIGDEIILVRINESE